MEILNDQRAVGSWLFGDFPGFADDIMTSPSFYEHLQPSTRAE